MATYLDRTQTAGNRQTFTISFWVKRVNRFDTYTHFFTAGPNPGSWDTLRFDNNRRLALRLDNDSHVIQTNREFSDPNAFYHIVCAVDTTQATASDRVKLYVNGVQETDLAVSNYPTQNKNLTFNDNAQTLRIGDATWSPGTQYIDGILSHVHFCDGAALAPTVFGLFDSVTGEWKINTSPSFTPGTNGFTILKDGMTITDQSANSNNFTLASGTLTKTEDNPSNVYAVLNSQVRYQGTVSYGNTRYDNGGSNWYGIPSTMPLFKGKYYWEYKQSVNTGGWSQCGVMSSKPNGGYNSIYSTYVGNNSGGLALNSGNGDFYHDGSSGAYSTSAWFAGGLSTGDIIGVALDVDASQIWFSQNGTWGNSSNPSTGSGGIDFSGDTSFTNWKPYIPCFSVNNVVVDCNFGNGYFGLTEITTNTGTGYQDGDGNGRFYYNPPTNFKCLSTKGINS